MENTTNNARVVPRRAHTLIEDIVQLRAQFFNMREELRVVQGENARLRGELARARSCGQELPANDVAALRRRVAYYCHPDRGGDGDLMASLNKLFDYLTPFVCPQTAREGTMS